MDVTGEESQQPGSTGTLGSSKTTATGSLLKLLKKSAKSEAEEKDDDDDDVADKERVYPVLVTNGELTGCLLVYIKNCREFTRSSDLKKGMLGFVRIRIGNTVKCTITQPCKDPKAGKSEMPLRFNEWKYFAVQIAKHSTDDRNKLVVELIFFEPESGMPKLLGKTTFNLLDIVHKMTFTELHDLKLKGQVICKIELEISFTYGSLGYGYSHQLRHPQKDLQTVVERSLFLRIFPLEQRKDPHFNVTTGRPSEYPEFLSPHLNVQVGSPAKSEHDILSSSPVEDLSIPKMSRMVLEIMQTRKRLNELKKVYENFQTRGESIQFIEKLVMKKGPRQNNPPRMYKKSKVNKWKKKAALISILVAAVTPEVKSRDVAVSPMKHVSFQKDPEQGPREHTTVDVAGLLKCQTPEEDSNANNVLEKTDTEELQLASTATCSTGTKTEELQPKKEIEDFLQSLDKKLSSLSLSTSPALTNQSDSQISRLSKPDSQEVGRDRGHSTEDQTEEKESALHTNVPVVPGGVTSVSVSLTKSSSTSVISKNMPAQDQDKNIQHSAVDSCVLTTWRSSGEDNREGMDSDQISSFKTVPWLLSSDTRETFSQPPCESTDVRSSEELKTITEDRRNDGELQLEDQHRHSGTITSKASDIAPVGHSQSRGFILNQEQISGQALSSPDPGVDPTVLKSAQEIRRAQPSTPRYSATVKVTDTGLESPKLGQKLEADITVPSFSDYFAPSGSSGTSSGPSQGGKPSKPGKEKPKMLERSYSPYDRPSKTAKKSCQVKK